MKGILTSVVLTVGLLSPTFAQDQDGHNGPSDHHSSQNGHGTLGAPAPLIGVGLPGLAAGIGYGVYLLVRRRRNVG
jgi:hypothetical protein